MFERIYKDTFSTVYPILQEAFPVEELREKQRQKALLDQPRYRLYGMKEESGILQGVIALWDFDDFLYVEHFAIQSFFRNEGIGGKRLDEMINWAGKPIVLEVEVPKDGFTLSRVRFYERHGFIFNQYPYLQPPMRAGQVMLPLRLMTMPQKLSEDEYKRYKSLIYKVVYNYEEA
jgi:GNAT superfamily N-acetyltransferase